jgi:hypothetical protein
MSSSFENHRFQTPGADMKVANPGPLTSSIVPSASRQPCRCRVAIEAAITVECAPDEHAIRPEHYPIGIDSGPPARRTTRMQPAYSGEQFSSPETQTGD